MGKYLIIPIFLLGMTSGSVLAEQSVWQQTKAGTKGAWKEVKKDSKKTWKATKEVGKDVGTGVADSSKTMWQSVKGWFSSE